MIIPSSSEIQGPRGYIERHFYALAGGHRSDMFYAAIGFKG